jgi:hypothetical protein
MFILSFFFSLFFQNIVLVCIGGLFNYVGGRRVTCCRFCLFSTAPAEIHRNVEVVMHAVRAVLHQADGGLEGRAN